jgi:hypothetical protein
MPRATRGPQVQKFAKSDVTPVRQAARKGRARNGSQGSGDAARIATNSGE